MAEAARTPALWLITLSLNLTIFMTTSITLHQVPYLTDKGFSAGLAATAIILLTTVALLVKFFWGWMANRIAIRYCIALSQTLDVIALVLLLTVSSTWSVIAYAFAFGLGRSEGLFNSHAYAVYFGRRFLGSTRGIVSPIRIAAGGGGPVITGFFFDITGDYNTIIPIFIAVTVLAVGCSLLAKPPNREIRRGNPRGCPLYPPSYRRKPVSRSAHPYPAHQWRRGDSRIARPRSP